MLRLFFGKKNFVHNIVLRNRQAIALRDLQQSLEEKSREISSMGNQQSFFNNLCSTTEKSTHCVESQKRFYSGAGNNHSAEGNNQGGSKKQDDSYFSGKAKDLGWNVVGGIIGGVTGIGITSFLPNSFIEERERKFRNKIGTDILEIENQHIIPAPRDYSQYTKRRETIFKIDSLFDDLMREKNYRTASRGTLGNSFTFLYSLKNDLQKRSVSVLLITGVQGSGKSELAEEYANEYSNKISAVLPASIRTIKIFRAENKDDLKQQYREFARELGIDVQNYADEDLELLIAEVNEKLALRDHWLLIFDNVNNKEIYGHVKEFIPKGNVSGRVILTASERNIIPEKDSLDVKIMDVSQEKYRFTTEEVVNLTAQVLGELSSQHGFSKEYKIELARRLYFLPQAVKRAALYIRHTADCQDIKVYLKLFEECLQDLYKQFSQSEIDKFNEHQRCKLVNDSVNLLSIRAISNNTLAASILYFSAFLNPDCIQRELLELRFVKVLKVKTEEFINALELLGQYGLLEDKGQGNFKMHRSVAQLVLSAGPMIEWKKKNFFRNYNKYYIDSQRIQHEKDFFEKQVNEVVKFTKKCFIRDNTEIEKRRRNALFAIHVNRLEELYNTRKNLIPSDLSSNFFSLKIALATHYMMTGYSMQGREILEDSKKLIEKQYGLEQVLDNLYSAKEKLGKSKERANSNQKTGSPASGKIVMEEEQKMKFFSEDIQKQNKQLTLIQTEVLAIYAQILYHLGCTYYDIGDKEKIHIYKKYLDQAMIIRDVIDKKIESNSQEKQKDEEFNEHGIDTKIMRRNGVLKFRYKETQSINGLERVAAEYESMIQEEEKRSNPDKKHLHSCRSELSRVYQKLSTITTDSVKKAEYIHKAAKILYHDKVKNAFNNQRDVDYLKILDWISNDPDLSKDTRQARYLNDLGNLLKIQGNFELAASCYFKAAMLIEEKENINIDLPDAYLGLASVSEENDIELARKVIKRCLFSQSKLGVPQGNETAEMARDIEYRVTVEVKERDVMERRMQFFY